MSSGLFIGMFAAGSMMVGNGLEIFPRLKKVAMFTKGGGLIFSGVASVGLAIKGSLPIVRDMGHKTNDFQKTLNTAPGSGLPSSASPASSVSPPQPLAPGFGTNQPQVVVGDKKTTSFWDFFFGTEVIKISDSSASKKFMESDSSDSSD
jgi:hypothetical protein